MGHPTENVTQCHCGKPVSGGLDEGATCVKCSPSRMRACREPALRQLQFSGQPLSLLPKTGGLQEAVQVPVRLRQVDADMRQVRFLADLA